MTVDLYNAADVKSVRIALLAEQKYLDALTGLPLVATDAVLDHDHNSQLVRGVLHRQSNVLLGKIENAYLRYMKYWYPHDLPTFLRACADYLERKPDKRWHHPGWIKKVKTQFNKLTSKGKDAVLAYFNFPKGPNDTKRKENFSKLVLTKKHSYVTLQRECHLQSNM
jgi:hypothetical protein